MADRYRLGPVLRRSAGCCAHRAYDELLQRTVRVTLVESGATEETSFSLRPQGWHDRDPEVAELFDAGRDHDRLFLVTHHPDEPTLAETTPPGGLDLGQLRDLGTAVATALVPRHQRGAAHGGLGAGTVAFTPNGTSLTEFGLLPWLARWGDVPVAPPYVAPEQRAGADSGPASDVYALGRLLGEFAPDHGLRPGLRSLLVQMTADDPADRPSMEDVRRRLAGRAGRRPSSRTGKRRLGLVAAACCLVGLGVGLSAFAGEVPAVGSAGATLSATAAVPAPILPLAPLSSATDPGVADDVVAHGTASSHTATPATASRRSSSSGVSASIADPGDSPRVADTPQRSATGSPDQDASDSDSPDRSPRPTTHDQDQDEGRDADTTPASTRSSRNSPGRSSHDDGSSHTIRGIVTRIDASLGHQAQRGSGKDKDPTPSADQADSHATSRTHLDPDLLESVTDSS